MTSWLYSQSSGQLWKPDGTKRKVGYAGHGAGKNAPAMEAEAFVGPIPRGLWQIGEPYDSRNTGPHSIPLIPVGHRAHGRTNFLIHGDSISNPGEASEGCIVLPRHIRDEISNSETKTLQVIE